MPKGGHLPSSRDVHRGFRSTARPRFCGEASGMCGPDRSNQPRTDSGLGPRVIHQLSVSLRRAVAVGQQNGRRARLCDSKDRHHIGGRSIIGASCGKRPSASHLGGNTCHSDIIKAPSARIALRVDLHFGFPDKPGGQWSPSTG